ncbi:MAG TPA: aspartate aminotransferase family protein [Solirubrobacteraceae bacterium]|jgi:diaminobutyrate-2-oxoglutarate transaminase|nr:aspartate aminotransferase family protein [Solirubrobacteraceae bacterium]
MSGDAHNFEQLHFAPAPALAGEVPGTRSRQMLAEQDELESSARSYPRSVPIAIEQGRGATLRDVDGNTFIDFFGGAGVLNVGHSHPDVLAAAHEQEAKLVHALDFPTTPKLALMRKLRSLLPGRLGERARFHFGGPTGSDAIESSMKLTRAHTGREAVIAFQGSYHGMTKEALSLTSDTGFGGPASTPVHFMPYPYCYRCPLGLKPDSCGMACAKLLETTLSDPHAGVPTPAAVLIEPIQGEGGTVVPPDGYLQEVRRITREHDVPLICDEIQTGFARTGTMFACEHDGVVPDAMTLSKALGGIGYPISCVAYDSELDTWKQGAHIGTFRGHQVAMAAGLAAIEFMQQVDLAAHAGALGEITLELLREAQGDLAAVGDVRGRGLMIGIELVRDRDSREPWREMAARVRSECFKRGVVIEVGGHFGNVARFLPPLTITRELMMSGVEIFVESVRAAEEALAGPSALVAG